ncbi:MAG: hypothetical protein HUJ73_03230 [Eubacterium sp.]|nr:hypothetical protein [Eubacterium sp.]
MKIQYEEIRNYLTDIKNAVTNDQYRIEQNSRRQDNRNLFEQYVIDEAKAKEILLNLHVEDFSEIRNNEHKGYEHELLYVFGKDVTLLERFGDSEKEVSLYIKFNKLENRYVIVISFHEQKYPIKYLFK